MKYIYYPGCRIKAGYPDASEKLKEYIKNRYGLEAQGCCKEYYHLLKEDTTALLICNNCTNDLHKNLETFNVEYVYELIDRDESFPFPDYQRKHFFLQDCFSGYDSHPIDQTVRSLLKKMNISFTAFETPVPVNAVSSVHRAIATENALSTDEAIITYCARCNLANKKAGKISYYLPELLFGTCGE